MRSPIRKSGSALLTVLLVLTALAAITLFTTRRALTSTRTASQEDNLNLAMHMAQSGIDEGLLHKGQWLTLDDLPGVLNKSSKRGFSGNDCATYQTDEEKFNSDCPSYEFLVLNYYQINDSNYNKFTLTAQELPPINQPLNLHFTGAISLTLPSGASINNTTSTSFQEIGANQSFSLKRTGVMSGPITFFGTPTGTVIVERPALLIEAIGYAGGVQKKLLYSLPRYTGAKATITDFGGAFDENGFLK